MKAIAITNKGIEDIASKEITGFIKTKPKTEERVVVFSAKDFKDLCTVCYKAQCVSRVLFLFNSFKVEQELEKTQYNIKKAIEKNDLSVWLSKDNTFKVLCKRVGEHSFSGQDITSVVGELIIDKVKQKKGYEQKTDMKNPDVVVYVFINNEKGYFGVDFAGFDLSKRDYKIFSYAPSIKATVAYALLRLAGFNAGKTLLDPFSGEGVVAIEAALLATNKPVNYYRKDKLQFLKYKNLKIDFDKLFQLLDKETSKSAKTKIYCFNSQMRFLSGAKKNSKIAGVNKNITFGRVDVEWLDARLSEKVVDVIVSSAPRASKNIKNDFVKKLYNELFYQAKYVLKKEGRIVLLSNETGLMKDAALKNDFKVVEERSVWQGKQELKVCVFRKI